MGDSKNVLPKDVKEHKAPMTDEERNELAKKLDSDLDTFISGLERRSYTEGWPEDRWQEEFEKHPFFMTQSPKPGEPLSPLLQGLQDLKYDTTENTAEELALTHKEDGNFNFKCKNYRLAIVSYTEGLKQKCADGDINAQLYNNRSASHYFLKNYRSCVNDCLSALRLKPDYVKTMSRAANCYFHLKDYLKCMEYCDQVLAHEPNNEILNLRTQAASSKVKADRDHRRKNFLDKKVKGDQDKLLEAVRQRGIRLLGYESEDLTLSLLEPKFPEVVNVKVYLEDGRLIWPVLFLYPEYKTTDFVKEFHEDSTFADHLNEMFEERPSWDEESKYTPDSIVIYYEDENQRHHHVKPSLTLGEVISNKNFRVDSGTPAFIILVKNSKAERSFLNT